LVFGLSALVVCAVVVGAAVLADDDEELWGGGPLSVATVPVGDITVEAGDVAGSEIDVKDVLEPQMTALLLTTDITASDGQTVSVQTSPTFSASVD
jgi:hypothetical protein